MLDVYYETMKKTALFRDIDREHYQLMMQTLKPQVVRYKKDAVIRREGEPLDDCGIIMAGEVFQMRVRATGERSIFEHLKENQSFGDILIFRPHRVTWATDTVAVTDCTIMFIKRDALMRVVLDGTVFTNELFMNLIGAITQRIEELMIVLRCLKTRTIRQKIATYLYERQLLDGAQLELCYNRDELADYLCLPRPTLSRALSRMKCDGIIDYHKSSISILDLEALERCL